MLANKPSRKPSGAGRDVDRETSASQQGTRPTLCQHLGFALAIRHWPYKAIADRVARH